LFQRHERDVRGQQARDDLAEAAHAGDQHLRLLGGDVVVSCALGLAFSPWLERFRASATDQQQRRQRHRQADDGHQPVVVGGPSKR
jgi:hypothetical protein